MRDIPALLYNFALIAGTTYLVVEYEWSMWCYLLTMLFLVVKRTEEKTEEKKDV
jgi:nicotinamide riboside transporter PnuC